MQFSIKVGDDELSLTHVRNVRTAVHNPVKKDTTSKLNAHVVCIVIGIAITVVLTFIPADWALHFAGLLGTFPAIVQEALDWLRDW